MSVALAAGGVFGLSYATASSSKYAACSGSTLAVDAPGDTTYAGQDDPELEDAQLDILQIDIAPAAPDTFVLTTRLTEVADEDPNGGSGMSLSVDLASGVAPPVTVDIQRSVAAGIQTATVGDSDVSEGLVFDTATHTITVTAPVSALGDGVTEVGLIGAETRATTPAVIAPLADSASGRCAAPVVPASTDEGSGAGGSGKSGRTPGEGNGKGKGNKPGGDDGGTEAGAFDPSSVTIAVIDTGIHAAHQEYDYDESVNAPNGQLVGWWDFSGANATGAAPDIWFEGHAPYDPDDSSSHGTGTSGMAAGLNRSPAKSPSACPGCKLAVAKVFNEADGSIDGDLAGAVRWAVDVVGADVVTMSIGSIIPVPEIHPFDEAAAYARSKGVLVTVSNGNGWGNLGLVPGEPGAMTAYGYSTHVLSVGASDVDGYTVTTDPEVAAPYTVVTGENTGGYHSISGTSFSAPFVAGGAARIIGEAAACGETTTPDEVERLIKVTAEDTIHPPTVEGYGVVSLESIAAAVDVVCGRAEAPVPAQETEIYVEQIAGTERSLWTETLELTDDSDDGGADPEPSASTCGGGDPVTSTVVPTPFEGATPAGELGPSTPAGAADTEIYELVVAPGSTVTVNVGYSAPDEGNDFDVVVYCGADGVYDDTTFSSSSLNGAGEPEEVSFTNGGTEAQSISIVIYGWQITTPETLVSSGLEGATLAFDGYALGAHV